MGVEDRHLSQLGQYGAQKATRGLPTAPPTAPPAVGTAGLTLPARCAYSARMDRMPIFPRITRLALTEPA